MASNRSKSKVLQNAEKAFKYSAVPAISSKVPYMTGTAQSIVSVGKDLREWTIRNNPFRAVNGNKDPLIRQIAAATTRAVKAAKLDLKSGDLTFSRLNKQVRDFVGYDDGSFLSADFDVDFNTDLAAGFSFDSETNATDNNQAGAILAIGDDINRTQATMTSAMIGAVEHSTERITKTQMVMTDTAVTRLISSNMTIAARTSSQLGMISENIEIVNKNLSLLVEQGNSLGQYINQSQRYMENTEQSLNDIKALLQHLQPKEDRSNNGSQVPGFLDGHFDAKKYLHHIFNNTMGGMMASTAVATAFKTLHLEIPSFINEMFGEAITEINPLKLAIDKLIPAIGRIGDLDKTFNRVTKLFFARLDAGEYGGFLSSLGREGFGARTHNSKLFRSGNYEKGTIAWNGRAERALMEVIPGYLSNIEGYLKQIAQSTYKGEGQFTLDSSSIRHYDYEAGMFKTLAKIEADSKRAVSSMVQSQYDKFIEMTGKLVDGSEAVNAEMTRFLTKLNSTDFEEIIHKDEWKAEFESIIDRHAHGNVSQAAKNKAYEELITARQETLDGINTFRQDASNRRNSAYLLGRKVNDISPDIIFDSIEKIKEDRYNALSTEDKKAEDARRKDEERKKSFVQKISDKMGKSDIGRGIKEILSYGGPLNKGIDFVNDQLQSLMIGLVLGGGSRPNSFAVGSHNIPNDQLANIHKGEMIIPKDIADQIRAGNFSDEKVQEWLNITAGSVENSSSVLSSIQSMFVGNSKTKSKTRKAMGAMVEYADDYYKVAIDAEAIKDGDLRGIWVSMLENMANQTAILAHNAERDAGFDDKDGRSDLSKRILGEKDKNGLYKGTMFSQYANIGLDFKNAIKHAMYGEEYVTSEGVKVAKSDDTVLSTLSKGMKKAGDTALSYIFGEDYKDTKQFKAVSKGYNELKAGVTGKASDGVQLTPDEEKAVEEALQQTADKGLELNKKLIGHVKGGLLGAITVGGIGLMGGGGVVPMLLGAGGPIGGAIIGAGLSILTRNESFMDKMFGEMKDGERVGGVISKEMQERWKDLGSKLLGPAVLGAAGSFIFPKITRGALGPVGQFMLGTGPIAGAALGIGASLIMKSKPVQDLLYGEEGKGGNTGLVGSVKNAAKDFWDKNKQHAGAMGLGGIGGALLGLKGASALGLGGFGVVGSIVGMSILGASFGLKATSDKFKDFLFGSRKFKRDKNGNLVPDGRDGDGLIGKISRKFITSVMTPARVFARSISRNFTEWIRYDVAHQLKSAFEPFTLAIKGGVQGIADGMHAVTDKLMDLAKKITNPIKKIVGGLLKFAGKTVMGGLKTGASIAGGVISAPLKVLGHFGRRFSKKYDPSVAANNRKFRFGYTDADGTKHRGFWNPLQRLSDAKNAFLDSDGGFFDALAAGGHMLNPFTAYADAKYQYAEDTGYKKAAFLGGFFGAAGQKHRQIKKANRRKDKMEGRIADWTAEWAKKDNWNDKVILNKKELRSRNSRLKKVMGKEYDKLLDRFGNKSGSLTSEEMIQFMYDPFGKKKAEKDTQANTANKANVFLKDIRDIALDILEFVSGHKPIGSALSGSISRFVKKHKGGDGRKKSSRNPGIVDSSMYDFMKAAKGKGFNGIRSIADATGIDVLDLRSFLSGNMNALDKKTRKSLYKQMGYIDTSTFGGKVKAAFNDKNIIGELSSMSKEHRTFYNKSLSGDYRKYRRAFLKMSVEERTKVVDLFNAGDTKAIKLLAKKDGKLDKTVLQKFQDKIAGIGNKIGDVKNKISTTANSTAWKIGGTFDKLSAKLGKRNELTDDERHFMIDNLITKDEKYGFVHANHKLRQSIMQAYGMGDAAAKSQYGRFLSSFAKAVKHDKSDNRKRLSMEEWKFSNEYLSREEKKAFKTLKPSDRKKIMDAYKSGNAEGPSLLDQTVKEMKEAKKKKKQDKLNKKKAKEYTPEEKNSLGWISDACQKSGGDKKEVKKLQKAFYKMSHIERAEIVEANSTNDWATASAKLRAKARQLKDNGIGAKIGRGLKAAGNGIKNIASKAAAGASSIFGSLLGSKGGLMAIGGTVIAGGLIFLLSKFPKVMEGIKDIVGGIKDWFVETAWPFITDKVIPAAKKIFETIGNGIGALVDKIVHAEEDGAAAEAAHFTGLDKTREELAYENKVAAETGLANSETMLRSIAGSEWWNGGAGSDAMMAEIAGKRAGSAYTEVDVLTALYVWLGNEYMLYNNPYVPPSEEELTTAANASEYADALKKNYKKIAKARGVKQTNYTKCSSTDKEKAIKKAVSYLNGSYGNFTSVQDQILSTKNTTKEAAAATATSYNSTHPTETTTESVGSGHFMQTDPRWANNRYANAGRGQFSTMGNGGCGPTALANAALSQGIRTNPMSVASMSRNGGYAVGGGTSAGLFTNGARRLGLRSSAIGAGSIKRALSGGNSVVFAGKGSGIYTRAGHIMSARGLDSRGNVIVDDPLRRNSISVPLSTIGRGMTHAWSIGRGADDDVVYSNNKSYPRVHSYEELSESAKNKDLTNYSDQDMGMLMAKCLRDDPSAGMNIADYYFLSEQRQLARDAGLRDFNLTEAHLSLRAEAAPYITFGNGGAYIYKQVDERWSKKPLIYTGDSSTIGNSGCVITSLGSMLTNITGLNYQPDFMTQQIAGNLNTGNNLLKILTLARSPSLKGARAERFLINDHTHAQQTNTEYLFPNVTKDAFSEDNKPFSYDSTSWSDEERRFLQVISGAPFVIYGGTAWSTGNINSADDYAKGAYYDSDAQTYYKYPFYRPSDGKKYSTHAMMVIPDPFNSIVDTSKTKFYLFDPGTSQFDAENQAREISYKDLFAPGGGVQSVFGLSNISTSAKVGMAQGEPSRDDIKWWQEMYTDADAVRKMYENTNYGEGRSYVPSTTPSSGTAETDGSDEGLLSKIMKALSGLGDIALGMLGRMFGGKGDLPTMSAYNTLPTYTGNDTSPQDPYNNNYDGEYYNGIKVSDTALSMDLSGYSDYDLHLLQQSILKGKKPGLTINDFYYLTNKRAISRGLTHNPSVAHGSFSSIASDMSSKYGFSFTPYSSLPSWAVTDSGKGYISPALSTTKPTSTKFSMSDIDAFMQASMAISASREGGWNGIANYYASSEGSYVDSNHYAAFGINGFNGECGYPQEVLQRVLASGQVTDSNDISTIESLIYEFGIPHYASNPFPHQKLRDMLNKYPNAFRYAQEGVAYQFFFDPIQHTLTGYEQGTLKSAQEMVLLSQIAPFGQTHVQAMLGLNPEAYRVSGEQAKKKILSNHFSTNKLTNLAYAMNDYYANIIPSNNGYSIPWTSYHVDELKKAYANLGGTEVLGFGGGISDSFNSGAYDIVDTPVAIGRTPKVEVDSAPVTTRLDVIINYLRQIANTARQTRAETAATNLDIGHGMNVEKRSMSTTGSGKMPATPVYTDIKNSDRMKAIHDRIARSPRPV